MINIDDLAEEITGAVRAYTEDVEEAIQQRVDEVAELVKDEIQRNAPKRKGKGSYAKGFKVTKADRNGQTRRIVWTKTGHRISHLLEFGHAKRGGGRVAARPHIRPAYDRHAAKLPEDIKRIIQEGGS